MSCSDGISLGGSCVVIWSCWLLITNEWCLKVWQLIQAILILEDAYIALICDWYSLQRRCLMLCQVLEGYDNSSNQFWSSRTAGWHWAYLWLRSRLLGASHCVEAVVLAFSLMELDGMTIIKLIHIFQDCRIYTEAYLWFVCVCIIGHSVRNSSNSSKNLAFVNLAR